MTAAQSRGSGSPGHGPWTSPRRSGSGAQRRPQAVHRSSPARRRGRPVAGGKAEQQPARLATSWLRAAPCGTAGLDAPQGYGPACGATRPLGAGRPQDGPTDHLAARLPHAASSAHTHTVPAGLRSSGAQAGTPVRSVFSSRKTEDRVRARIRHGRKPRCRRAAPTHARARCAVLCRGPGTWLTESRRRTGARPPPEAHPARIQPSLSSQL